MVSDPIEIPHSGRPAAPAPVWVDGDPLSGHANQVRVDINALVRRADLLA